MNLQECSQVPVQMDQVPEALLAKASQSVTAWLVPNEMAALRRESRRRGLALSRLARELIVSSLKSTRKERRRGTSSRGGDGRKRAQQAEGTALAAS
jgi:hypothetical protein